MTVLMRHCDFCKIIRQRYSYPLTSFRMFEDSEEFQAQKAVKFK